MLAPILLSACAALQGAMQLHQNLGRSIGSYYMSAPQDGGQLVDGGSGGFRGLIVFLAVMIHVSLHSVQEVGAHTLNFRAFTVLFDRVDHRAQDPAIEIVGRGNAEALLQARRRESDRLAE
jgi:hypothetical protein